MNSLEKEDISSWTIEGNEIETITNSSKLRTARDRVKQFKSSVKQVKDWEYSNILWKSRAYNGRFKRYDVR